MVGRQRWVRWAGRATFVVMVIALTVTPEKSWLYAQGSSVTVRIELPAQTVPLGNTFTLQIVADLETAMQSTGLAGYEFELVYNTSDLEATGVTDGGELSGPNSRTTGSLGPNIDNAVGRTRFGAYSYKQSTPQIPGPVGSIVLASVTLQPKQAGVTTLSLENVFLVDTQANVWPDAGRGRQISVQGAAVNVDPGNDTPTVTITASPSLIPSHTPTSTATETLPVAETLTPTPTATDVPTSTATLTPPATVTTSPTLAPTSTDSVTPTPGDTATATAIPIPTDTKTVVPTETATVTPTSSVTLAPTHTTTVTSTPTATQAVTSTPTPTASVTPAPTPTTAPPAPFGPPIYLPMVARNWQIHVAPLSTLTPTGTPTATVTNTPAVGEPQFTCMGWCDGEVEAGMRYQIVTSDRPVEDWRAFVSGMLIGVLTEERATWAILEAPEGVRVRIEARHNGVWLLACESVVECSPPDVRFSFVIQQCKAPAWSLLGKD